ncbi:protein adenylyltransferase SelO [Dokdonella koreensis]|uniref:Protein nucleotidyltransferase YdiU n=1 Tax=Dokdonella koreensis DS-123 TaxID=1300342 RepID=A0A160DS47_9GAMM|nr:YdiU family protein [Dokdonella koreensis]ANB17065.1 Hypothetical protein I596_1035 [Dokdonella koreensis DS-123]
MDELIFDNTFLRALPGDPLADAVPREVRGALHTTVMPTPVAAPRLLAWSREMAGELGFSEQDVQAPAFAAVFAGNALLPGMQPYATNYGGHQFGHWAGQLGDGRAIALGEAIGRSGHRWELQLKGAGRTPYSRSADGRAVLRSSVREFLCSEAMHHLGVPTTRALCLVATGEAVLRDMFYDGHPQLEPGAIVCRAAPSFIRFGHFELPAARGEQALLEQLVDFTITRHFPHLTGDVAARRADWFGEVCERTARLMAEWMRVGFVHGVMNTDNLSILGLTIDYGPYGWIEDFDPDWTPNTTDRRQRRYRFGQQPAVAYWNLGRLAQALSPLFASAEPLQAGLQRYVDAYVAAERAVIAGKLGLADWRDGDDALMAAWQDRMRDAGIDMTLGFRALAAIDPRAPSLAPLADAFYDEARRERETPALLDWLARYAARLAGDPLPQAERSARMRAVNPRYVLRNYLAQQAIERAEQGDAAGIGELLDLLRHPYEDQPGREAFAARRPDWARDRPGCSMLSCSS